MSRMSTVAAVAKIPTVFKVSLSREPEYSLVPRPLPFLGFGREVCLETARRRLAFREGAGEPVLGLGSFLCTGV